MQEYTIKAFEDQPYGSDAYIYIAGDYEINKSEVAALLKAQEEIEALWYTEVGVLLGLTQSEPKKAFRLYDSTYLVYTEDWQEIDQVSAFLVNQTMRAMCAPQKETSLMFGAVSEDLVRLFNDTVFVVGMTYVQAQETITIGDIGHRAADTDRLAANHPHHG